MTPTARNTPIPEGWVDVWLPVAYRHMPTDGEGQAWACTIPSLVGCELIEGLESCQGDKRPGHDGRPMGEVVCLTVHPDYVRHFTDRIPTADVPLEVRLLRRCLLAGYPPKEQDQTAIADRLRAEAARVPMDERRKAMMARTLHQLMLRGLPADRTLEIAREVGADTADADGPVDTDLRGL